MTRNASAPLRAVAALPVAFILLLVGWFVRTLPQNAWDWTDVLVTGFTLAQLPSSSSWPSWAGPSAGSPRWSGRPF